MYVIIYYINNHCLFYFVRAIKKTIPSNKHMAAGWNIHHFAIDVFLVWRFGEGRFPWNEGSHFPSVATFWGPRSCEVAIIWPDIIYINPPIAAECVCFLFGHRKSCGKKEQENTWKQLECIRPAPRSGVFYLNFHQSVGFQSVSTDLLLKYGPSPTILPGEHQTKKLIRKKTTHLQFTTIYMIVAVFKKNTALHCSNASILRWYSSMVQYSKASTSTPRPKATRHGFHPPIRVGKNRSLFKAWGKSTLPETNSHFAPENGWQRKRIRLPFGAKGLFSEAFAVSFREGIAFLSLSLPFMLANMCYPP